MSVLISKWKLQAKGSRTASGKHTLHLQIPLAAPSFLVWMAAGECYRSLADFSEWTHLAIFRCCWGVIYYGSSIFRTGYTKRATTLPLWSSQTKGDLGRADFSRLRSKKRTAGMVPCKRPLCWKWVWQPLLSGYLRFQMAGIHLWNQIKQLRRSVWYRAPELLIIHAFWTGCQLFSYRELHIGNVQICNKEKKISNFPLYASLRFTHEDDSYHPISRRFSLKSPYHFLW